MSKKAIILCMSCNQERYINEEHIIRKTWGKDILEGKYDNIELMFYRGGSDNTYLEGDVLHLTSDDTLIGTYQKSIDAFNFLLENKEFDYIIRTNTSTYINVDAIQQFLNFDVDEKQVIGPHLTINNDTKICIPYLGGHFLIMHKYTVNILITIPYKYKTIGIDDSTIGQVLGLFYKTDYTKHIKEADSISNLNKPYLDKLSTAYCVRVKDESNLENNIVNMIGIHFLYKNIKTQINPPHGFTKIYTLYGQIPI